MWKILTIVEFLPNEKRAEISKQESCLEAGHESIYTIASNSHVCQTEFEMQCSGTLAKVKA